MADGQVRTIYIVRKLDPTGVQIYAHCETLRVANRIAALTVGADVVPFEAVIHDGFWCAPYREVLQTAEDIAADQHEAAYRATFNKALALGLTLEEIDILEKHDE